MTDAAPEDVYSDAALEMIERPGGYTHESLDDPITGRSLWLEELHVPLDLANRILEAHSVDRASTRHRVPPWEATLEDLADDLYVRCTEL